LDGQVLLHQRDVVMLSMSPNEMAYSYAMTAQKKRERIPRNVGVTLRHQLIDILESGDHSFEGLRRTLHVTARHLEEELRHVQKTLAGAGRTLSITPAECAGCGKTFEDRLRKHLHAPGRCPDCKHNRIYQPLFRVDD